VARILAAAKGAIPMSGLFPERPRYAAPEQFGAGGREADPRSDVYSFGVVLYELLTGRCPVAGHDPFSTMAGHLSTPPLPFAESDPEGRLPPDLREIVLQALAKDPGARGGSADDLARRLAAIAARYPEQGDYLDRSLELAERQAAAALRPVPIPPPPEPQSAPAAAPRPEPPPPPPPEPAAAPPSPPAPAPAAPPSSVPAASSPLPIEAPPATAAAAVPPPEPPEPALRRPARDMAPGRAVEWDERRLDYALRLPDSESPASRAAAMPAVAAVPSAERTPGRRGGWAAWTAAILAIAALGGAVGWSLRRERAPAREATRPSSRTPAPAAAPSPPAPAPPAPVEVAPAHAPLAPVPGEKMARTPPQEPKADREGGERPRPKKPSPSSRSTPELLVAESAVHRSPPERAPATTGAPFQRGDLITRKGPGVEEPELKAQVEPPYPAAAAGSGRRPKVRVGLLVDENGNVIKTRVAEGDSSRLGFNEAAQRAAEQMRYFPATQNGVPGKFWTDYIFEFEPPHARGNGATSPPPPSPPPTAATPAPPVASPPTPPPPVASPPPPAEGTASSPPPSPGS
jgi:TonB family protein